jgi:hypothetical protein
LSDYLEINLKIIKEKINKRILEIAFEVLNNSESNEHRYHDNDLIHLDDDLLHLDNDLLRLYGFDNRKVYQLGGFWHKKRLNSKYVIKLEVNNKYSQLLDMNKKDIKIIKNKLHEIYENSDYHLHIKFFKDDRRCGCGECYKNILFIYLDNGEWPNRYYSTIVEWIRKIIKKPMLIKLGRGKFN